MLYIFQYTKPSPHYIAAIIPRCKNKEFDDNPNVVLTIGGGQGVFNEEEHLSKFTALLSALRGPILPAIRHFDLSGSGWKMPHVQRISMSSNENLVCKELSTIKVASGLKGDFCFSEYKALGRVYLRNGAQRIKRNLSDIEHLPFTTEYSSAFVNYYLFVYSLFLSCHDSYLQLKCASDLSKYLDQDSGISDLYLLNTARNNLDSLSILSPEQQKNWHKPIHGA